VVHAVHDLEAAAAFYARAGFQVGARNRHPWGTHNRIVQLAGFFIELLALEEPDRIAPPAPGRFSFGAFQRDYLQARQGLSMVLLESADARADQRLFDAAGIGGFEVFDFEREGEGANGATVKVGFSLAFARDARSPHAGFAVCQHHHPQNFGHAPRQRHANGARGIRGVTMIADHPADHHIFLSAFTGVRVVHASSMGVVSQTPRGDLEIMAARSFRDRFGVALVAEDEGATLAGLRLAVDDIGRLERLLREGGVPCERRMGRIVIGPEAAFGATLIFEEARS
jgi:hypothetical protein